MNIEHSYVKTTKVVLCKQTKVVNHCKQIKVVLKSAA